jgi:LemA protein
MAGVITREAILPHFKQNPPDYGGGIEAGADAIGAKIFYGAKPKVPFEASAGAQTAPTVNFNTGG